MALKVLVVIPVFNECRHILQIIQELKQRNYEYLIVDDGSTDETPDLLKSHQLAHLRHAENRGQGAALRTGFEFADSRSYQICVHFDGDGQHRAEDIEKVIYPLISDAKDIVFGSRFLQRENAREIPTIKRTTLRVARIFEGLRTGIWLSDAHCGLRALKIEACRKMEIKSDGMAHASEILSETKRLKLQYAEVPVLVHYRKENTEKTILFRIFNVIKELYFKK